MRSCQILWFHGRHFIKLMFVSRKHKLRRLNNTSHPVPSLQFKASRTAGRKLSLKWYHCRPRYRSACLQVPVRFELVPHYSRSNNPCRANILPEDFLPPFLAQSCPSCPCDKTWKSCPEFSFCTFQTWQSFSPSSPGIILSREAA